MTFYSDLSSGLKKPAQYLMVFAVLGIVFGLFGFTFRYAIFSGDSDGTRQISVSGEGKIAMKPDMATFSASILTEAKNLKDAQTENNLRSEAVVKFLEDQEIEEKNLKTIGYSIIPQYQYFNNSPCYSFPCPPTQKPEITGYEVRHTLEIKIAGLEKVDSLLDGVTANGANEVSSIQFGFEDDKGLRESARKQAIEDAKKKAEVLARDLGVRLGSIVNFSESGIGVPIFARSADFGLGGEAAPSPSVQAGEQEIRANVTITYELR